MELEKWYQCSKQEEFKRNPKLTQQDIDTVREWMSKQRYFPVIPDQQIILFLQANGFSIERTKENIDNYFTMRTLYTDLFSDRNYFSEEMNTVREVAYITFLDGTDEDGNRVLWTDLRDPNPGLYWPAEVCKYFGMLVDSEQLERGTCVGYTAVLGFTGATFAHAIKWPLTLVKQAVAYNQDGSNLPIKKIFFINVNPAVESVVNVAKKFMSQELASKVNVLSGKNSSKIFDTISKKVVPSNYGGDGKSMGELHEATCKIIAKYADYYLLEEKLRVNDLKRAHKSKHASEVEGIQGSFKKLDLD